ncbi:GHKL domain-containing protein [bacterium]|nr:GHKL domain-containing protein [bacterium]
MTSRQVCWELFRCRDRSCPVFGDHIVGSPALMRVDAAEVVQWRSGQLGPVEALSCQYFRRLRERGRGRRAVDRNLDLFLERALRRAASFQRRLAIYESGAEGPHLDELSLLGQFSQLIPNLGSIREVCFALLTVVTAGQGLGFNRAMLFWRDLEEARVDGHCAIGPGDDREADRIWRELAEQEPWLDLRELVRRGLAGTPEDAPLARRLRSLSLPAQEPASRFSRALWELQELHGERLEHAADRALVAALDLQHFVTLPLVRAERSLGFLLVDNRYSGVSLAPERIDVLQVLVRFATGILENLILRESLERSLARSQASAEVLAEIRRRISRAEKLAASGELSAAVAHEIRNPLTAIGGFSRRLLRSSSLGEEDRRTVQVIAEEALRLEETLGRLLHSAQREELQVHPVDLNALVRDIESLLRDRVAEAGIRLTSELEPDLPRLTLDERRLKQVLLNLVQNAIEAIEGKGEIHIETEREEGWLLLHVADNGCGMSPELQRRIFRAFYTTKDEGTGLGLALSQRYVRQHGGELSVESTPGVGTRFSIRLPLRAALPVGAARALDLDHEEPRA